MYDTRQPKKTSCGTQHVKCQVLRILQVEGVSHMNTGAQQKKERERER